jgi:hypothetical protein
MHVQVVLATVPVTQGVAWVILFQANTVTHFKHAACCGYHAAAAMTPRLSPEAARNNKPAATAAAVPGSWNHVS